jgi:hypothetical protein
VTWAYHPGTRAGGEKTVKDEATLADWEDVGIVLLDCR